ncbi:MAG TPA: rhodanese-like domain-containing protein [Verrucomicrobiae bacterium]|nr:rhodanese-like domain-containing protein [Verrucomicrobiae bacterium]
MSWSSILIIGLVLAVFLGLKRLGLVSADTARKYLKEGALVVDVRSTQEFKTGHLSNAVNIPLGELQTGLPRRVSDKNQVLLLHCLSGTRSGIARRALKAMGYANVFNLGSYGRAKSILNRQN